MVAHRFRQIPSVAWWVRLLLVCLWCPIVPAKEAEPVDLFTAGAGGYVMYRIPGIAVTGRGTMLVYCEARAGQGDWTPQDVLLRRSIDGGRTWSEPRQMAKAPPDLKPNPAGLKQKLSTADVAAGKFTAHNAVAIPDLEPGVVHFLYHIEYARVFYLRSSDDGETWSPPREITAVIEGFRDRYPWLVVGNGCGHAIQLARGPHRGRLVIPLWLSLGTGGHAHRPSDLAVIYSDDRGETWQRGDFIARNGGQSASGDEIVNPNETTVVELSDGRVLANIRSESRRNRRLLSISADGATGWSKPEFHEQLLEPVCMGSMARLADGGLLFANPDNLLVKGKEGKPGQNRDRRNLTIKLSRDDGKTWPVSQVVEAGPSGYSDLAVGPDGTIHCFFERGDVKTNYFHPTALSLACFGLMWLTETKGAPKAGEP
ncbi:MAG: sialidase family protein [Planctomycetota bacterium]|nr:sialidase family protein [Planctomycetota bacterium]